tara:strand:- start:286 stop:591 length:306 start_codon:yes stop_codon:yes gene_type:complete
MRMTDVIDQLNWLDGRDYSYYEGKIYKQKPQIAAVYKADIERLLDYVDWTDEQQAIDTDAMQITLNEAVDNYFGFINLKSIVEHEIVEPITKWATTSRRIK